MTQSPFSFIIQSVTRVLFSIAGEHNHQPPKPVHVSKDEAVESLVCALRGAHRMITVGVDCLAPWSSENGLLLDLQAALTTHSPSPSPPPARSPSPRSDLAARLSPQLDSCCAELQFELLPALLGCEARDLPEHFPRLHSLLCIWFTAAETSYLDQVYIITHNIYLITYVVSMLLYLLCNNTGCSRL